MIFFFIIYRDSQMDRHFFFQNSVIKIWDINCETSAIWKYSIPGMRWLTFGRAIKSAFHFASAPTHAANSWARPRGDAVARYLSESTSAPRTAHIQPNIRLSSRTISYTLAKTKTITAIPKSVANEANLSQALANKRQQKQRIKNKTVN